MPILIGTALTSATGTATLYAGLFLWSFLAATVLPLSSEAPLAALVYKTRVWLGPVVVATIGNYLGACTTYGLARWASRSTGLVGKDGRAHRTAVRLVAQYGAPVMLLSWVPLAGDALVAVAGAAAMPFTRFSLMVVIGKAARYAVVAWLALKI